MSDSPFPSFPLNHNQISIATYNYIYIFILQLLNKNIYKTFRNVRREGNREGGGLACSD